MSFVGDTFPNFYLRDSMVRKSKFQRQGTFQPQESDILSAIDERFEELEETIALASLVPQLHERLHAVEQMLKIGNKPTQEWSSDSLDKGARMGPSGPRWGDEQTSPRKIAPPDDEINSGVKVEMNNSVDAKVEEVEHNMSDLTMASSKRRSLPKITDISRGKVKEMDEKTLDTQTSEYYSFGESTWDLVIFIGTGALGPFGSFQTFLLAIVNVLMQIVFVAIAYYNFTTPDINENSIVDSTRCKRDFFGTETTGVFRSGRSWQTKVSKTEFLQLRFDETMMKYVWKLFPAACHPWSKQSHHEPLV